MFCLIVKVALAQIALVFAHPLKLISKTAWEP